MTKEKRKIKRAAARDEKAAADALQAKADKKKRNMEAYKAKQHQEMERRKRQERKRQKALGAKHSKSIREAHSRIDLSGAGSFMVTKKEKEPDSAERQRDLAELKTLMDEFHQLTGTRIEITDEHLQPAITVVDVVPSASAPGTLLLCSCGEGDCAPGYLMCPACIKADEDDAPAAAVIDDAPPCRPDGGRDGSGMTM